MNKKYKILVLSHAFLKKINLSFYEQLGKNKNYKISCVVPTSLINNGETLELTDSNGEVVDNVTYSDGFQSEDDQWPQGADAEGSTLELINFSLDNSLAENWLASIGHGSPGSENLMNDCEESLGDINGDNNSDVLDVVLMVNFILGGEGVEYTICQEYASDINADGIIDILDVILLVNIIVRS